MLVLTTFHTDEAVYGAIRAGASGFVLKAAAPDELGLAVRAVAAGGLARSGGRPRPAGRFTR